LGGGRYWKRFHSLFVVDGAKALSKAIRRTFGRHTLIQRCQVHKARNITERIDDDGE